MLDFLENNYYYFTLVLPGKLRYFVETGNVSQRKNSAMAPGFQWKQEKGGKQEGF